RRSLAHSGRRSPLAAPCQPQRYARPYGGTTSSPRRALLPAGQPALVGGRPDYGPQVGRRGCGRSGGGDPRLGRPGAPPGRTGTGPSAAGRGAGPARARSRYRAWGGPGAEPDRAWPVEAPGRAGHPGVEPGGAWGGPERGSRRAPGQGSRACSESAGEAFPGRRPRSSAHPPSASPPHGISMVYVQKPNRMAAAVAPLAGWPNAPTSRAATPLSMIPAPLGVTSAVVSTRLSAKTAMVSARPG